MKGVISAIDVITTSSTHETIRYNKCQARFLEKLVFKQDVGNKLTINGINFSMLESPSTSYDNETNNGVSKSTVL